MRNSFGMEGMVRLVLFLCYLMRLASAIVYLKPYAASFVDAPAKFAVGISSSGICGALHMADPLDACSSLLNDFQPRELDIVRFALIVRGNCSFDDKIRNAQAGGFQAAIVYDDRDKRNLVSMIGNPKGISVQAVFVSKEAGEFLTEHARGEEGECCINPSPEDAAWTVLLISFISLLVILSVLATFLFSRYRRLYHQGTNHHVPIIDTKMVEVLPCFTFNSARSNACHMGETCAICLEDYKDGEKLRVLPCQHEFHASCVDSWLTKWGTFCPVCKHNISTNIAFQRL
ncbi:hypothetical protein L1049_024849 [Liquidambar formosana]|uniref:RING-type domain-containing protein n=1 Tax=Liquidambar formosana TaxID=63359 RepID=A0AAP0S2M5_LIQFO